MRRTTLRIAAAAIGSAMVLGASATAASAVPAAFSTTGALSITKASPTIVVKVGTTPTPATTLTCTAASFYSGINAANFGVPAQGWLNGFGLYVYPCVTGTGQTASVFADTDTMLATKSGSAYSLSGTAHWHMQVIVSTTWYDSAPGYAPASYSASWVNYPTAPASRLVFNNAPVGLVVGASPLAGQPITLTGTFSVTKGGSPITLI